MWRRKQNGRGTKQVVLRTMHVLVHILHEHSSKKILHKAGIGAAARSKLTRTDNYFTDRSRAQEEEEEERRRNNNLAITKHDTSSEAITPSSVVGGGVLLGVLLLVVLVEREPGRAQRRHRRHLLLHPVPLRVLGVLLRLVLLVLHFASSESRAFQHTNTLRMSNRQEADRAGATRATYNGVCAGGDGAEPAELLQVLVVLLLLLVVHLAAGAPLLLAVLVAVEQVVVVLLLLSHLLRVMISCLFIS
jgi:hypothetical protein